MVTNEQEEMFEEEEMNEGVLAAPKSCENFDNSAQYDSNRAFAFEIMQRINGGELEENVFISPMSISIALAMLYNGTNGSGAEQMDEVLRLNGLDLESHNQNYFCLLEELGSLDSDVRLDIANSIWGVEGFEAKEEFLNYAQEFLGSDYFSRDFSDPAVLDEINTWISDNTGGNINNALDQIPPLTVIYLINAIYFNADWKYTFDSELTFTGPFESLSGDFSDVDYMRQTNDFLFTENSEFKAIDIPYGNDAFSLSIVLPNGDVNDFVEAFSDSDFENAIDQLEETEVILSMPKFEMAYDVQLAEALEQMGMPDVFTPGSLENIQEGWDLAVSRIIHKTFLEIDEEGTEAAAVTIIEVGTTSVDPQPMMNVNRPFLFYIRDRVNNNVLFSGKIVDLSEIGTVTQENIIGTWNIDSVESTIGSTVEDAEGSGTFTFNADMTGSRNTSFSTLGNLLQLVDMFTWEISGQDVIITNQNGGMETWTRTVDSSTEQQLSVIFTINAIATKLDFQLSRE